MALRSFLVPYNDKKSSEGALAAKPVLNALSQWSSIPRGLVTITGGLAHHNATNTVPSFTPHAEDAES